VLTVLLGWSTITTTTAAFVAPSTTATRSRSSCGGFVTDEAARPFGVTTVITVERGSTALEMARKPDPSKIGTNELDYGLIFSTLFNPANPYSWFLYFFIGITVYGAVSGSN
jgi:hypothetical protein